MSERTRRTRPIEPAMRVFHPGDTIHGVAGGAFGPDSTACRQVESVGADWLVTRSETGVEFCTVNRVPTAEQADDRGQCSATCEGPDLRPKGPLR